MIINYSKPAKIYTESQLIAYIGNKRRLLPLIQRAFELLEIPPNKKITFYDPFAGTGVVSRFAKTLGFQVIANDWENYSYVINKAYLEINESEIDDLFKEYGGLQNLLNELNSLPILPSKDSYIAKYYCPKKTHAPDLKNERLFYTRETGEKMDAIRESIDRLYPNPLSQKGKKSKSLLLALLLHETATRANTSGVFKAFHQGFGGLGKDALGRILKPLSLQMPTLVEGKYRCKVFNSCANRLTRKLKSRIRFDIAYIDPPYNQHQYGSNYHLLNTVALNDKPPVNAAIYIGGKKVDKSAIRKDWVKTKSSYCYKNTATKDFAELIDKLNAHYILVSYSTDGIIPFDEMLNILSQKGKLDIVISEYTKYRGGKQALTTEKSNIEFLLLIDTEKPGIYSDITRVKESLTDQKIQLHLKKPVDIMNLSVVQYLFSHYLDGIKVYEKLYDKSIIQISIQDDYQFAKEPIQSFRSKQNRKINPAPTLWKSLPLAVKKELEEDIQLITSVTKDREIEILLRLIENRIYYRLQNHNGKNRPPCVTSTEQIMTYYKKIPHLLKKFNNRKAYKKSLQTIQQILDTTTLIRSELPNLYYSKPFHKKLIQLKKIIENKINHNHDHNSDEINYLKTSVSNHYYSTLGAA